MTEETKKAEKIWEWIGKFLVPRSKYVRTKPVTEFVKRQRELEARNKPVLLWNSQTQGTYTK